MRTTLTLDDDLADVLRERARLTDRTFRQVVNDALRRGLSPVPANAEPLYRVEPHHSGFKPGVDPMRLNHLNDSLQTAAFADPPAQ